MKELFISSIGLNPSNFSFSLPYCSKIKLLEASIPMSFKNVPSGSFTITGAISGLHTITVANDRYTQTSFATYLQSLITASIIGQTYTVTQGNANNFVIASSTEAFSINGGTLVNYIGFSTTATAMSQTGTSTFYNFFPSHMFIKIDKVYGIDNGTIYGNGGIFHAVPLCVSGVTNYRSDDNAPWVKLINLFGVVDAITIDISLQLSNGMAVDMNGDNWAMKIFSSVSN